MPKELWAAITYFTHNRHTYKAPFFAVCSYKKKKKSLTHTAKGNISFARQGRAASTVEEMGTGQGSPTVLKNCSLVNERLVLITPCYRHSLMLELTALAKL